MTHSTKDPAANGCTVDPAASTTGVGPAASTLKQDPAAWDSVRAPYQSSILALQQAADALSEAAIRTNNPLVLNHYTRVVNSMCELKQWIKDQESTV